MNAHYMTHRQARDLIRVLEQVDTPMTEADASALAQPESWTVTAGLPGRGFLADGPWDLGGGEVTVLGEEGIIEHLTVAATAPFDEPDFEAIQDYFTTLIDIAREDLGPPTHTVPGPVSRMSWQRSSSTITLTNMGDAVTIRWATNEYQKAHDESERGDDNLA